MSEDNLLDEKKKNSATEQRYLQFALNGESYAVFLLDVKEVIPIPEITVLPNCPSYYEGIMNLRGQIISIIDLRKKLGMKSKESNKEEAVIIIEIDNVGIGVIVDSIDKVLNVVTSEIKEVPEVSSQINAKYIEGIYQHNDILTVLLDLKSILDIDNIKQLNKVSA